MNDLFGSLVMFALTAFCASRLVDGFRAGKMQPILRTAPIFDRINDSMFFWTAAAFNAALVAVGAIGGVILLIGAGLAR